MAVQNYKDLEVWKKAISLVQAVYTLTEQFPKKEIYTLSSQIRRAAISIPSNLAEGRAKRSTREFMRFVNIACGSAAELETQLIISQNLGYASSEKCVPLFEQLNTINRMLNGLHVALEKKLKVIA